MKEEKNNDFEYVKEKIVRPGIFKRIRKKAGIIMGLVLLAAVCILGTLYYTEKRRNQEMRATEQQTYLSIPTRETTASADKEQTTEAKKTLGEAEIHKVSNQIVKCMVTISAYKSVDHKKADKPDQITTGIILRKGSEILILTDLASVKKAEVLEACFSKKYTYDAKIKGIDSETGLAVLSVHNSKITLKQSKGWNEAVFGNLYAVTQGSQVIYAGAPIDQSIYVDDGKISSVSSVSYMDGAVNILQSNILKPGTTNGFLFDIYGNVLAILNDKMPKAKVCVATEMNGLMPTIERMMNGLKRPYMGLTGEAITDEIRDKAGADLPAGVYVNEVEKGSPIYQAGIHIGDIIIQIGDVPVSSMNDVRDAIDVCRPGDTVHVRIQRKNTNGYLSYSYAVTLGEKE